jgi:hypothetical protein
MSSSTVAFLRSTCDVVLVFPDLQNDFRLVCYSDGSFGTNADHTSQLGYLIMLMETAKNAHILTWFIRKSARVTVGVLMAETLAVVATVDKDYAVRMQLAKMGIEVELELLTDSKQLYSTLEGHGSVQERRLMLDIAALRQYFAMVRCYGALAMCMVGCAGPPTPSKIRMYHTLVAAQAFLAIFTIGPSATV